MRWRRARQSHNIEDRRGGPSRSRLGGRLRGSRGAKAGGFGGLGLVAIVIIGLLFGVDPGTLLQIAGGGDGSTVPQRGPIAPSGPADDETSRFIAAVLGDTEDTWNTLFQQQGQRYREPTLVLFSGSVRSACGFASSATGPFYCPGDQKVYLDTSFFQDLSRRFGAPGDFAQAYVIAHEVGHHIQTITGITGRIRTAQRGVSKAQSNALQVGMELQADCLAGVWAHHAGRSRQLIEAGDIEEALRAAAAIGDDTLQKQARGYVVPESFTHGTSAQRQEWFSRGYEQGRARACDTFQ
ncbi:MAG: neutral zinc metallopeptidase [Pseudomonadota bacterium]